MDGLTLPLETEYGPLSVRILAGPTLAPGAHVRSHDFEDDRYRPVEVPPHVYAVAETSGYGPSEELSIHGVAYRARAAIALTADGWKVEPDDASGWNVLRRAGYPSDPTPAACKAWREEITPAVLALLRKAEASEVPTVEAMRDREYAAAIAVEVARLRAEADRLERLAPMR